MSRLLPEGLRPGTGGRVGIATVIGLVLGLAPFWLTDDSPLWPSAYSDEAQWVLEQVTGPGFLFSLLVGRGTRSFAVTVVFNVLFWGLMAYSYLHKPAATPR